MGLKTSLIYQIFSPFCKHFILIPKDNFDFSQRILQFVFFFLLLYKFKFYNDSLFSNR